MRRPRRRPRQRPWPWRPFPAHVVLVAAWAVLFLYAGNIAEVHLADAIPPLGRAIAAATALLFALGLLARDLRRAGLVASGILAAWYGWGHVAGLLAPAAVPREWLMAGWALALAGVAVLAWRLPEARLAGLTRALGVVTALLVGISLVQVVPIELGRAVAGAQRPATAADDRPAPAPGSRDIWYIVLDRYGSNSSLEALGGFTSELPGDLAARGFTVIPHAHANYGRTAMSFAATLDMTTLDDLAARMGPDSADIAPVNEMIQDHALGRYLQGRGYRYVHLGSWFGATKTVRIADENPTLEGSTDFETLLETTSFGPTFASLRGEPGQPAHHRLHRGAALFGLGELERIRAEPGPKLVIAHLLLPHEPYVFDEVGRYPTPAERAARSLDEGYRRQMLFTNDRVLAFVDELLAVPEPARPIVVIAADEGPYPDGYAKDQVRFDWSTATTDDLEIKYGILMALYLPGEARPGAIEPYDRMTPLNLWPVVLSRYFDGEWPTLPDRSWTSASWKRPYDLADITDRLP